MKRLATIALVLGIAPMAHADGKAACALMTRAEAEQLIGGPLGDAIAGKAEPGSSDPKTECDFFPKGYRFDTAEGPPEPGLTLTVHTTKTADSAKRFYEASYAMTNEAKADAGSPFTKDKISKLKGIGDAAFLVDRATFHTAFVFILKGSTLTQVQVWKQTGSAAQIATTAAKQVAGKL